MPCYPDIKERDCSHDTDNDINDRTCLSKLKPHFVVDRCMTVPGVHAYAPARLAIWLWWQLITIFLAACRKRLDSKIVWLKAKHNHSRLAGWLAICTLHCRLNVLNLQLCYQLSPTLLVSVSSHHWTDHVHGSYIATNARHKSHSVPCLFSRARLHMHKQ